MATFSKKDLIGALTRLGRLAIERGSRLNLMLIGGGVMVLVFEARQATRDMDVVVLPPSDAGEVRALAAALASECGWPGE